MLVAKGRARNFGGIRRCLLMSGDFWLRGQSDGPPPHGGGLAVGDWFLKLVFESGKCDPGGSASGGVILTRPLPAKLPAVAPCGRLTPGSSCWRPGRRRHTPVPSWCVCLPVLSGVPGEPVASLLRCGALAQSWFSTPHIGAVGQGWGASADMRRSVFLTAGHQSVPCGGAVSPPSPGIHLFGHVGPGEKQSIASTD